MAEIIPNLNTIRYMTPGERRFARRLESLLEDDYTVWYDVPVGSKRRYPDFLVLHPSRGLLFLEVKDWKMETLHKITPKTVDILGEEGLKTVANPLEQARQYAYALVNRLQQDSELLQPEGAHKGNLIFPYGYGVVFTNITRQQWNAAISETDQERVLPSHRLICKDEMTVTRDPEIFQQNLWDMFEYNFRRKLTLPQIDRIRWHLFPEVRIGTNQASLFEAEPEVAESPTTGNSSLPSIMRVMDLQQEQLARSMGDGHRVIHGVAGSGKTLILGYRCLHLAPQVTKPILVLCFNITLAARLRGLLTAKGLTDKVHVHHFHEWCNMQLKTYHVDLVTADTTNQPIWERQVQSVIGAVERKAIPGEQYSAVMIDEGQDFQCDWLKLVVQMIDSSTNSLLLLYDDAQSVYQKKSLSFPLSSAGVQARGRTTILRFNYRNTREILDFSYAFAGDFLKAHESDEDYAPLIAPESAGGQGPSPEFRRFETEEEETSFLCRCLAEWHRQGRPWQEMAVIYGHHRQGQQICAALAKANLPCIWLKDQQAKRAYDPNSENIPVMSRQSAKGLEFDTVILAGIGGLDENPETLDQEMRLLYVGMTRARRHLLLTASGNNWFVQRLSTQLPVSASAHPA